MSFILAFWLPEFGNPALLWGLPLALVPLALHLLFRHSRQIEPWGAMRFLQAAVRKKRYRLRLESLLQMFVRSSLLGLLVLAAAEPRPSGGEAGPRPGQSVHRILVLDTSLSMTASDGRHTPFEKMLTQAEHVLAAAKPGDSFQIVESRQSDRQVLIGIPATDISAIRRELESLAPRSGRGDLPAALRRVESLLAAAPSNAVREVLLFTDLQRREWLHAAGTVNEELRGLWKRLAGMARCSVVDMSTQAEPNASVHDVAAEHAWTFTGQRTDISVAIRADAGLASVAVDLFVDGAPHSRQTVSPQRGEGVARFDVSLTTPGDHVIRAELPADGLNADNSRTLVMHAVRSLRVLIVDQQKTSSDDAAADYLATALQVEGDNTTDLNQRLARFETESIPISGLKGANLNDYDCIILKSLDGLTGVDVELLRRFVVDGGGLIAAMDGEFSLRALRQLDADDRALFPLRYLDEGQTLREPAAALFFATKLPLHPVVRPFEEFPDAGFQTTRVYRYLQPISVEPGAETVVQLTNGDPLLADARRGQGRVLMLSIPFDDAWTSWVVWPSFIPMLHEAVQHAAAGRVQRLSIEVGDIIDFPQFGQRAATEVSIIGPDGETRQPRLTNPSTGTTALFEATSQPGIYRILNGGSTAKSFAVNTPATESDLTPLTQGQLSNEMLVDVPVGFRTSAISEPPASASTEDGSRRLGTSLLLAAGLMLLVDVVSTWRMGIGLTLLVSGLAAIVANACWGVALEQGLLAAAAATCLPLVLIAMKRWTAGRQVQTR